LLTPLEFSLIKTHSQIGYNLLKDIEFPWDIATMVLQHHERLDGSDILRVSPESAFFLKPEF